MTELSAIQMLGAEHRVIEKVVSVAAMLVGALGVGEPVMEATLEEIMQFMNEYMDKAHHGKEEGVLFPFVAKRGLQVRGSPVALLKAEHQMLRVLSSQLAEASGAYAARTRGSRESVAVALRGIVDLYPGHAWREDYLVFPAIDRMLDAADQVELKRGFEEVNDNMGRELLEHYAAKVEAMVERTQTPAT